MSTVTLHHGDCRDVLQTLQSNSIDSVVTDPPYALVSIGKRFGADGAAPAQFGRDGAYQRAAAGFMGKRWDTGETAFSVAFWAEVLRVLKPGGHLAAFGGTRTYHRLAVAIENAGFEIRDMLSWTYGCLDEATMAISEHGPVAHRDLAVGDRVLCYDVATGVYSMQPVIEVVEYDYDDTAYRLVSDAGEQVVSRNHRCIVDDAGTERFTFAETLGETARLPLLQDLRGLLDDVRDLGQVSSRTQRDVRADVQGHQDRGVEARTASADGDEEGTRGAVRRVRDGDVEAGRLVAPGRNADVLADVQRRASGEGVGEACPQRNGGDLARGMGTPTSGGTKGAQPVLEGRGDAALLAWEPRGGALRALPAGAPADGAQGRLCDGAPDDRGEGHQPAPDSGRSGAPCEPSVAGQPAGEPDALRDQLGPQALRGRGGQHTALVRVVPFRHVGKVWCLRVPTGAFVAVRGGLAFPTGNSGFPKSHDVSKGIDRAAGAEHKVVGTHRRHGGGNPTSGSMSGPLGTASALPVTEPETDEARQYSGWGTALKPAHEPICLARKPLDGTVATNVLRWETGAINIEASRVGTESTRRRLGKPLNGGAYGSARGHRESLQTVGGSDAGRWPPNLLHDGSPEVVSCFPGQPGASFFFPSFPFTEADRIFYCPKAGTADRAGSKHPTVKPIKLLEWLIRLVTPPGGVVLDPFAGSGTTGQAARNLGFDCVLAERETEYVADIRRRLDLIGATQAFDADLFG